MGEQTKYRLVTRSDFDGLVCAVLLKELRMIASIKFVHPKDMQDGKIEITERDITTNLPYVEGVYLAFDHHQSEIVRVEGSHGNHIIDPDAPSAARVLYEHFGGKERFPNIPDDLMEAVDKADSAHFNIDDVLHPKGWELLNYLMDARTGLGRFRQFRISNYQLMLELIDACGRLGVDEILQLPDVKERVDLYFEHEPKFEEQLRRCSTVYENVVVVDLRNEEIVYAGNRFLIYAMNPICNVSIHVLWGLRRQNVVLAVGKSIFDRSLEVDIGELMLKYGGGGHSGAGTCQVPVEQADRVLKELVERLVEQPSVGNGP
jgi:nanoRNase/pAp phosphatase (c-di-AMP/oligoRNAs hydrolase)